MKSQVLHTVWCNVSGAAAGGSWNWSLLGVKGSNAAAVLIYTGRLPGVLASQCLHLFADDFSWWCQKVFDLALEEQEEEPTETKLWGEFTDCLVRPAHKLTPPPPPFSDLFLTRTKKTLVLWPTNFFRSVTLCNFLSNVQRNDEKCFCCSLRNEVSHRATRLRNLQRFVPRKPGETRNWRFGGRRSFGLTKKTHALLITLAVTSYCDCCEK